MEGPAIPRPLVPDEVLDHATVDGEDLHDYEFVLLDYAERPEYEGPGPVNLDLTVKLRCRTCGRVISPGQASLTVLREAFQRDGAGAASSLDWDALLGTLPAYTLPEGVGRFDVRRISDDGTMEVVPIGYAPKRRKRGRTPRLVSM